MDKQMIERTVADALALVSTADSPREQTFIGVHEPGRDRSTSLAVGGRHMPRGTFQVIGVLEHCSRIQPASRQDALLWMAVLLEYLADNPDTLRVLTVDAWRGECGWDHNQTFDTGERFPREMMDAGPRKILAWFRANGLLDPVSSPGCCAVHAVGDSLEIVKRSTGEPLFFIEWTEADGV